MGLNIQITCGDCGYKVNDADKIFYIGKDFNKIVEQSLNISTNNFSESKIYGRVFESYCSECKSYIKFYIIEKQESNLTNDELFDLITKLFDKPSKVFLIGNNPFIKVNEYGFYKELSKSDCDKGIECPNCRNMIPLRISFISNCPNCGSKNLDKFIPCVFSN